MGENRAQEDTMSILTILTILTSATRTADDVQLPAPGTWTIDPAHTVVGFSATHLGVAKVRGEFRSFAGTVVVADDPEQSKVTATIEAASIDTREPARDAHLRSEDFLDAANHPTLTFSSTGVQGSGRHWRVDGDLTIRGITRPVVLDVEFAGVATDEEGRTKAILTARTEFDRTDFGLTWNQVLEAGRVLVGKRVAVELDVQLTPCTYSARSEGIEPQPSDP